MMSLFISCISGKKVISTDDLPDDKILIVGLVEYDYTSLESSNINGVEVCLDSEEDHRDFYISKQFLPRNRYRKFKFISIIGDTGIYELNCKYEEPSSASNSLLLEKKVEELKDNFVKKHQKYIFNEGKIISIGKILVKYTGGNIDNNSINYSYSLYTMANDSLALIALRESYPEIYSKYKNEIFVCQSVLETCLEFVLNHISKEKSLIISEFMKKYPDRVGDVFRGLNMETQVNFVNTIENFTAEELNDFLYKK